MNSSALSRAAALCLLPAACGGGQEPVRHADGHPPHHGAGHPGAHHGQGHGPHAAHQHDFSDAERWARVFDDPERDEWQRPADVVDLLRVEPGMTVVDLGAGTGYFLPHLTPAVGPQGRVLALDVEPEMVAHMERRIAEVGLEPAEARTVAPDDPGLDPDSVDRILVVNTWHHIADRVEYGRKLARALRPGGFVLVVDFTLESEHGPPREMRLPPEAVARELEAAGLAAEVADESLPMQYAVRGTRG